MRLRVLFVAALLCLSTILSAQVAVSGDRFAWDYAAADITTYGVVRFEVQLDNGAWTDVGLPPAFTNAQTGAGKQSHAIPFPAMQPGQHTITIRACNVDVCGAGMAPFAFKLAVVPVDASGGRIIKGQ